MTIIREGNTINTEVYRKPTNTGLLLHYQSHTDERYKKSLLRTMLYRAHRLSSSMVLFTQECKKLEQLFLELKYPRNLIKSITKKFLDDLQTESATSEKPQVTRIVLPFKNQRSANAVRRQTAELSSRIGVHFSPVFTSRKLNDILRPTEPKPALINRQKVVYQFKCDQCEAGYVGYTSRHLHQRIKEHEGKTTIGEHMRGHGNGIPDLSNHFSILKKCKNKWDCLMFEMLFIRNLKPGLNKQKDSISSKLF